ncbi:hypothetical protein Vadar_013662 [Vaccinium darrowii]|uniref:Uncharacterized protein n=1 Tax=Vaccinium darrowii TaxID=229202 RepID=A0ACB7ZJ19_9ERIC|nr:hypothetical protein Vadar_013662 [Vaccinium darrowii]
MNKGPFFLLQFNLNGSSAATAVPTASFYGNGLKKAYPSKSTSRRKFRVVAEVDEKKQTDKDRWKGLVTDTSDDQQDITRGKGMVDSFSSTHGFWNPLRGHELLRLHQRRYNLDNNMDGFYIAPAFMDKLVVHITKNFLTLPNIKVPLILGIWGGKGQGKSFQCELVFAKMGINPIMMSAGELESGNAGEPAKLIRQRYREAADIIRKGKMCVLFVGGVISDWISSGASLPFTDRLLALRSMSRPRFVILFRDGRPHTYQPVIPSFCLSFFFQASSSASEYHIPSSTPHSGLGWDSV